MWLWLQSYPWFIFLDQLLDLRHKLWNPERLRDNVVLQLCQLLNTYGERKAYDSSIQSTLDVSVSSVSAPGLVSELLDWVLTKGSHSDDWNVPQHGAFLL